MVYEALAVCKLLVRDVLKTNLDKTHNIQYDKAKAAQRASLLEGEDESNLYHWLKANFGLGISLSCSGNV